MILVVKFNRDDKIRYFESDINAEKGQNIIVEMDSLQFFARVDGKTNGSDEKDILGTTIRIATDEDYDVYLKNLSLNAKALKEAKKMVKKLNLDMNLIDANYSFDKKQLLFNFVSAERIDFRDLVKELANKFHTRIELFQIGIRDKSSLVGGIGLCGRKLCCNNHLKTPCSVNINMVKNQNIALNPAKINGACGRLLCCFTYENDLYEKNNKDLPSIGEKVVYKGKNAVVDSIDILNKTYIIKYSNDIKEKVIISDENE